MEFSDIQELFVGELKSDAAMQRIYKVIMDGGGNYRTAAAYAQKLGQIWSKVLNSALTAEDAIAADVANALIFPALMSDYEMSADVAAKVQKALNSRAGISLRAMTVDADKDHVNEIIGRLTSEADTNMLSADVLSQLGKSAVDDTIEANARFQSEAGLKSYISRTSDSGCCAWCDEVSGVYEYGHQPDGFYRQHNNCSCVITFMPAKQSWQRITYGNNSSGKRTQNRTTL